ncbi:uncharacterized protein P174DRAFT_426290 [Aspergillus novofumigatus IBT 16806]|uniref:Uncharacterized protein n=1 Tax=Aspergillus novofumigatus (strain IBT 16806) TaxID=1392255 RepID=A0A2I1CJZ3_ASPN1|nr:uncharacterized protein P174DRAFT_426290 [Aspergillus novofumigatus IBT 16806]PKX97938.1 hypothetical protein P174DRAFT_426290 [Aspergillus novofumigatus IBT 16806]
MAMQSLLWFAFSSLVLGSVSIVDPSDYADLPGDVKDDATMADYTTDNGGPMSLSYNITGPYYYVDKAAELDHKTLTVNANDTSVLVATHGATVNLSHVEVIKEGYCTWLNQASFFGQHYRAQWCGQCFSYGTGTTVYVSKTDLYSSGPVSHGLYAAGNATIYASNVRHYSGGNRCSSFSGDSPAGYLFVSDSVAHTAGIGSAIFYALGEIYGTNVVGLAEKAPMLFSDEAQKAVLKNVDLTAGLLAGTVMFSSSQRRSGASISFENSRLTTLKKDMAALWFGNIIATATLVATELNSASGILVIANSSQVTQAFQYFAGSEENPSIQPAEVTVSVAESALEGDIVAYNGSSISWSLTDHSSWTGSAYTAGKGTATFAVSLDETCTWTLTRDVSVQDFTNADANNKNIRSRGYNIYYNPSAASNAWLKSKTVSLPGGGHLKPRSH